MWVIGIPLLSLKDPVLWVWSRWDIWRSALYRVLWFTPRSYNKRFKTETTYKQDSLKASGKWPINQTMSGDGTVVFLRKTHVSSSRQDWWTCRQHVSKRDPLFSMKVSFTLTLRFFFFFCWVSSISKVSSSIFQKVEYNLWNTLSFGGSKKEAFTFLFPLSLFEPALHEGSYLSQLWLSPHRGR